MGTKFSEVGGGPATGLANDFVSFLQQGLNTGSFGGTSATQRFAGANPMGATQGIGGILNDILMGGAGQLGGSLNQLISKDTERQSNELRSRYGMGGGTGFGTPAAYGEALLRSEQAPKLATAIGGLQTNLLGQLLPAYTGLAGRGISQRETVAQPNPWATAASIVSPIAGAALTAFAPNPLSGLIGALGQRGGGGGGGYGGYGLQTPMMNAGSLFQNAPFIGGGGNLFGSGGGLGISHAAGPSGPLWANFKPNFGY